jgi:hypothetical protein
MIGARSARCLLSLAALAALACDPAATETDAGPPDAGAIAYSSECDNIDPSLCLLPWPSSFFLVDDPSTATGRRVSIPTGAMPADRRGRHLDPAPFVRADGFSPATSMVISFPGLIDASLLADEDHVPDTLEVGSTTVIVDAETGERVAHFAELDGWEATDPERAPLYLRPAARLREGARYVVGIRGLRHVDGSAVAPSSFFAALRDGTTLDGADVEARRAELEDVFTILEAAGAPRGELIRAWSFETASGASITRDLVLMRDTALADLGADGLGCTVTGVEDASAGDTLPPGIWRRIEGTFTMPSFLVGPSAEDPEQARLMRGPDGAPTQNGRVGAPFLVLVPESVRAGVSSGGEAGRLVIYGHGILGNRYEIDSEWMTQTAGRLGLVVVATDWWGMSRDDLPRLIATLSSDFDSFDSTPERLHQGIVSTAGLMRAFKGSCAALDELAVPLDAGGTAPAYAADNVYFYGNSLGAILGGTLAGVATDSDRFALGVGAGAWTFLITRSDAWRTFGDLIGASYDDALTRALMILMTAGLWDPIDAASYAPHLLADPLPGTPVKHVMMQIGIGDVAVSNDASHYEARTIGLPLIVPSVAAPFGLAQTPGPADSALTIYRLPGVDPIPPGTHDPGPDTPTHNGVRSLEGALLQLDAFLRPDGRVIHACDGPCDPD